MKNLKLTLVLLVFAAIPLCLAMLFRGSPRGTRIADTGPAKQKASLARSEFSSPLLKDSTPPASFTEPTPEPRHQFAQIAPLEGTASGEPRAIGQLLPIPQESIESTESLSDEYLDRLRQWSAEDPQACAEWILKNLEGANRERALAESIGMWSQKSPASALDWLASQGDAPGLQGALAVALNAYARQDAAGAVNWLQAHGSQASLESWETLYSSWGESDPLAAANWFVSNTNPALRDALLPTLLASLTNDSAAALILHGIPPQVADAALGNAATSLALANPSYALKLATTISDPNLRQTATQETLTRWMEVDPAQAQSYAAQNHLTLPPSQQLFPAIP